MIDDLDEVLALKASARSASNDRDWEGAIADLDLAVAVLHGLRRDGPSRQGDQATAELADCYGMIGGNERRWALEVDDPERRQRLELSVAAYDQGYQYERELTSRNASTYNRINRLTSRVLLDADVLRRPGGDPDVLAELAVAESILVEQVASERMGDPWGYADLGLVRLLRGLSASEAYRELDRMRPQRFVYESALATLRPLARAAGSLLPEIEAAVRYLELAARAARD